MQILLRHTNIETPHLPVLDPVKRLQWFQNIRHRRVKTRADLQMEVRRSRQLNGKAAAGHDGSLAL